MAWYSHGRTRQRAGKDKKLETSYRIIILLSLHYLTTKMWSFFKTIFQHTLFLKNYLKILFQT